MLMTEAEWLACSHPGTLIQRRRGWRRTTRKLRLLVCACYRRIWHLPSNAGRAAIEVAERHADGGATNDELHAIQPNFDHGANRNIADNGIHYAAAPNRFLRSWATTALVYSAWAVAERGPKREAETLAHCHLARDLFGNPFRPSPPLPPAVLAWNDGTVRRLAHAIYEKRRMPAGKLDTARLAILADALLDAGCDDEELIQHCRSDGPHVRGCWAVDLILGKE
jgi:hypothetical protein